MRSVAEAALRARVTVLRPTTPQAKTAPLPPMNSVALVVPFVFVPVQNTSEGKFTLLPDSVYPVVPVDHVPS